MWLGDFSSPLSLVIKLNILSLCDLMVFCRLPGIGDTCVIILDTETYGLSCQGYGSGPRVIELCVLLCVDFDCDYDTWAYYSLINSYFENLVNRPIDCMRISH